MLTAIQARRVSLATLASTSQRSRVVLANRSHAPPAHLTRTIALLLHVSTAPRVPMRLLPLLALACNAMPAVVTLTGSLQLRVFLAPLVATCLLDLLVRAPTTSVLQERMINLGALLSPASIVLREHFKRRLDPFPAARLQFAVLDSLRLLRLPPRRTLSVKLAS